MKTLKLDVGADGIAVITIDVPGRPMNVLVPELLNEIDLMRQEVATRGDIKGAIFTSGKASGFIAGADLKELVEVFDRGWNATQVAEWARKGQRIFRDIETCGKPFVAAINGLSLGGGLELSLACHYRVLSNDPRSVIGLPEATIGLLPGGGGTQRLPRLIGIEKALPLMLQGRHLKPEEALNLGIVNTLAPTDKVVAVAREWLLSGPEAKQAWDKKGYELPGGTGCLAAHANNSFMIGTAASRARTHDNWPAPLAILSAVFEGTQLPIDLGLEIEVKYFSKLVANPVARNLIRTMFINKGAADKLRRRPKGTEKSQVKTLGILGAGTMGSGIAYCAAAKGIEVVLLDANEQAVAQGRAYSEKILSRAVERGLTTPEKMNEHLARIRTTLRYEELAACDFVVEAVFEDRAVKAAVTAKAEAVIDANVVFASNTSTLMITSLAERSRRPENFIGLHFFSPVDKMPLVEVIVGKGTSDQTLARALDFVGQLRKTPIVINDGPAFYTTRVFCTYVDEGMQMLADGIEPALIENAAKAAGMPVGPLAVIDETTQDLRWKVAKQARADGLSEHFSYPTGFAVLEKMCESLGRKGRRFGGGFYDYPEGAKKHLWPGLKEVFPARPEQPDVAQVKKRLLYIQALEAAKCFEEGVLTEAPDGDLGSILGVGFPSWTGGALSFIDTIGIGNFVEECEQLAAEHGARFTPTTWLISRATQGTRFYAGAT